jgi:hypothetical protein
MRERKKPANVITVAWGQFRPSFLPAWRRPWMTWSWTPIEPDEETRRRRHAGSAGRALRRALARARAARQADQRRHARRLPARHQHIHALVARDPAGWPERLLAATRSLEIRHPAVRRLARWPRAAARGGDARSAPRGRLRVLRARRGARTRAPHPPRGVRQPTVATSSRVTAERGSSDSRRI